MIARKSENPREKEAAIKAATQFGEAHPVSDSPQGKEFGGALARLAVHEENAGKAIEWSAQSLMRQNPGLSREEAYIWAEGKNEHPAEYRGGREVTLEEAEALMAGRNTAQRMKMGPELGRLVEEARIKVRLSVLALPGTKKVLKDYERCLRKNDGITAAFCFKEIESLGLGLSDEVKKIERNSRTKLNLDIVRSGYFTMLGLS